MALFSWSMQIIKRSTGRSVVAAAAYRAGEKLHDSRTGITHDYSRRHGVEHTAILVPDDAPGWCQSLKRDELWNLVEATEKRKDSQLARELRIMIPRELQPSERIRVVRDYLHEAFVSKGMICDVAWHNPTASDGLEQPHAHVLITMRTLGPHGFAGKSRHEWIDEPEGRTHPDGRPVQVVSNTASWNCPAYFDRCREDWERIANDALARMGSEERIDRRSLLERGLLRLPEPALRMAWYMRDLYGTMKERFGQYQVAKHYQAVERATKIAMAKLEENPNAPLGRRVHTVHRFYNWFERQLARLEPAPRVNEFSRSEGRER